MLNRNQEVLSKLRLLLLCHLCSNVSLSGSPAAKVLTANKVTQKVALAQSTGERAQLEQGRCSVYTTLSSVPGEGLPWGPVCYQVLLAKQALRSAGEAAFRQRSRSWLGEGKHTRDTRAQNRWKDPRATNGASATRPFHFLFYAYLLYSLAWWFVYIRVH